jgi:hypothetical protein
MESAPTSRLAATQTVTAYSEQSNDVAAKLEAGERHVQPWSESAAYNPRVHRLVRIAHKRGYIWIAKQYELRTGQPLQAAPVWVAFDLETIMDLRGPTMFPQRRVDSRVVALEIPHSAVLYSRHFLWTERVLRGVCLHHGESATFNPTGTTCRCTARSRRTSWEGIFSLPDDRSEWQGIVDRIEPTWFRGVLD